MNLKELWEYLTKEPTDDQEFVARENQLCREAREFRQTHDTSFFGCLKSILQNTK
jgi:hypothetical protein